MASRTQSRPTGRRRARWWMGSRGGHHGGQGNWALPVRWGPLDLSRDRTSWPVCLKCHYVLCHFIQAPLSDDHLRRDATGAGTPLAPPARHRSPDGHHHHQGDRSRLQPSRSACVRTRGVVAGAGLPAVLYSAADSSRPSPSCLRSLPFASSASIWDRASCSSCSSSAVKASRPASTSRSLSCRIRWLTG
jgi:hypothetical protein